MSPPEKPLVPDWHLGGDDPGWQPLHRQLRHLGQMEGQRALSGRTLPEQRAAFEEAYEAALGRAQKATESILKRYSEAIVELARERQRVLEKTELDLTKLSLLIAKTLVNCEPATRSKFTASMAAYALKALADADTITLRMAPQDMRAVCDIHPELPKLPHLRLVEDPSITQGGVVADSDIGRVDATLEARLRTLAQKLHVDRSLD